MVQDGKSGLTEAVVTGPGRAVLFYGWGLLGEGLSLGEVQDTMFTLSGAISWVGKQAQLSANLVSPGEGWQSIAHTIPKGCIKPRGPGCPCSIPPASTLINLSKQDQSPWAASLPTAAAWWEVPRCGPRTVYQEQGWVPQWGWDWGRGQWDLWATPSPSPSPDHGFESYQSSASTSSSVLLRSERLGGSRHSCHSWQPHQESGGHTKINLPVFKNKDTKDAVTYQSWHWDLTVYCHPGCQDCTVLS